MVVVVLVTRGTLSVCGAGGGVYVRVCVCVVCVVRRIKNTPCLSRVVPTCS